MANLTRWDPFTDLRTTMDRFFEPGFARPWRITPSVVEYRYSAFPVEMSETEDAIEVKALLPGVKPEEVDITVTNDVLTIKAEHKGVEAEDQKRDYYRREIRYGAMQRSLSLPVSVDSDKAEARFDNGELVLRLPKADAVRPRQIKLASNS